MDVVHSAAMSRSVSLSCRQCQQMCRTQRLLTRHMYFVHNIKKYNHDIAGHNGPLSPNEMSPPLVSVDFADDNQPASRIVSTARSTARDLAPNRDVAMARRQVLTELQHRASDLRETLRRADKLQVSERVQRRQAAVFPPAVPRYQPPRPTPQEVAKVRRFLFAE